MLAWKYQKAIATRLGHSADSNRTRTSWRHLTRCRGESQQTLECNVAYSVL